MFMKIFIFGLLIAYEVSAQTASNINCGQVEIPQQSPVQAWNLLSWYYPGLIAAQNCNTGFLQGSYQALTNLYNQMYQAAPPGQVQQGLGQTGQQAGQQTGQTAQQTGQQAGQTAQQTGQQAGQTAQGQTGGTQQG